MSLQMNVKKLLCTCVLLMGMVLITQIKPVYAAGIMGSQEPVDAQEIKINTTYTIDFLGNRNADLSFDDVGARYYKFTITKPNDYYLKLLTLAGNSYVEATILNEDLVERKSIIAYAGRSQEVGSLYLDEGIYYLKLYNGSEEVSAKMAIDAISKPGKVSDFNVEMQQTGFAFGKKHIHASWTEINGVTGYQVQYSLKKNMKGAKSIKASSDSADISKITADKVYYVRVRAYNESSSGKKYYGAWTKAKKIKARML